MQGLGNHLHSTAASLIPVEDEQFLQLLLQAAGRDQALEGRAKQVTQQLGGRVPLCGGRNVLYNSLA